MGSLSALSGYPLVLTIPAFVFVLALIVIVHEMGHYLVGRWSGIKILAFSFGFGPELAGFTDKHGTRWKLSAIPLGGYVRFYGDADAASTPDFDGVEDLSPEERAKTFLGAKLWKRAATVAAGPIANFVLAIVIFTGVFMAYGEFVSDPVVGEVIAGSPAAHAGIQVGDRLLALDGERVETFDDISRFVSARPGIPVKITLRRNEKVFDLVLTPLVTEVKDRFGNKSEQVRIGIGNDREARYSRNESLSFAGAVTASVEQTWHIVTGTFGYIGNVVSGRMSAKQLGGPIAVAQAAGQVATLGFVPLLQLAAILSVSIGLLNLMPVPVLDGGHLMFYAVEAIRRKPVGQVAQEIAYRIGMILVLSLMLFVTIHDVTERI
jgi:regulator of sigma E protease